jgi:hypothetical protein
MRFTPNGTRGRRMVAFVLAMLALEVALYLIRQERRYEAERNELS